MMVVKRNLGGKMEVSEGLYCERERIGALKEFLDIILTEEEREGIRGREVASARRK